MGFKASRSPARRLETELRASVSSRHCREVSSQWGCSIACGVIFFCASCKTPVQCPRRHLSCAALVEVEPSAPPHRLRRRHEMCFAVLRQHRPVPRKIRPWAQRPRLLLHTPSLVGAWSGGWVRLETQPSFSTGQLWEGPHWPFPFEQVVFAILHALWCVGCPAFGPLKLFALRATFARFPLGLRGLAFPVLLSWRPTWSLRSGRLAFAPCFG